MKKSISLIAVLCVFSILSSGQDTIPNGGFEYWSGVNQPAYWQTTNQFLPPGVFTAKQVASSVEGESALQLQTLDLEGTIIPGVATLGILDIGSTYGGVPYNERPLSLSAYVKHPSSGDEVMIFIEFLKEGENIGTGYWSTTDSIGMMTPITIPINFNTLQYPDTMNFTILTDAFGPGSSLTVDGLQFNFPMTGFEPNLNESFEVFPNPCEDHIQVNIYDHASTHISLLDINGRKVKTWNIQAYDNTPVLDVSGLSPGLYFVILQSGKTTLRQKIIKR